MFSGSREDGECSEGTGEGLSEEMRPEGLASTRPHTGEIFGISKSNENLGGVTLGGEIYVPKRWLSEKVQP